MSGRQVRAVPQSDAADKDEHGAATGKHRHTVHARSARATKAWLRDSARGMRAPSWSGNTAPKLSRSPQPARGTAVAFGMTTPARCGTSNRRA